LILDRPFSPRLGAIALAGGFVLAYVLATAEPPAAIGFVSLIAAYALGLWLADLEMFWIGWCVLSTLGLAIYAFFLTDFLNPNYPACFVAIGLAAALAYRLWWFIPPGIIGLALFQSRGAIVAASAAAFLWLWRHSRVGAVIAILVLVSIIVDLSPAQRADAIAQRLGIWHDTMAHLTVWGHGYGNFAREYASFPVRTNMTLALAPHAYNDFLELTFDFGLFAIPLWLVVALSLESADRDTALIVVAFLALGLTFFPFYVPGVAHAFVLTLGHAVRASSAHRLRLAT